MRKLLVLLGMAAGVCSAEIVYLDFTQADPWGDATGQSSFLHSFANGYSVTLEALPTGNTLFQGSNGIGVGPYIADEINGSELLRVSFVPAAGIGAASVDQMFMWVPLGIPIDVDRGAYRINDTGEWHSFSGDSDGSVTLDIHQQVSSITFRADPWLLDLLSPSDYSIRGMQVSIPDAAVPDGGMTLMLLGGALFGLEGFRRKFRA